MYRIIFNKEYYEGKNFENKIELEGDMPIRIEEINSSKFVSLSPKMILQLAQEFISYKDASSKEN